MDYETVEKPEISEKIAFSEKTSDNYGSLGMDNDRVYRVDLF